MKTVFDGLVSRLDMVTKDSSLRISQQQLSKLKSKEKKTGKKYPRTVVQMHSKNSRRRRGKKTLDIVNIVEELIEYEKT